MGKRMASKTNLVARYVSSRPKADFPSRNVDTWEVTGTANDLPVKAELPVYWDGEDFAGWDLPPDLDRLPPRDKQRLLDQIEPKGPQAG